MKYKFLLNTLRFLIYIKRFSWWLGTRIYYVFGKFAGGVWYLGGFVYYKLIYLLKKAGLGGVERWFLKRDILQTLLFLSLFLLSVPQTKLYAVSKNEMYLPGQKTIAYALSGSDEEYSLEEVSFDNSPSDQGAVPVWKEGALSGDNSIGSSGQWQPQDLTTAVAGGSALSKPLLLPGAITGGQRSETIQYVVESGDSLSSIAYQFGVSVATILWENNLGLRSILQPGNVLRIPPTTGLTHAIKRGDTIKKIALIYGAKAEDIIKFNKLKEDGSDLVAGEQIMIPNGVKPQSRAIASVPRNYSGFSQVAAPPSSTRAPSASGFVWPSAARVITQYFNWTHHGLDISGGGMGTANYAAKVGTVEEASCGWNRGYGCYVVINHGGGVKTLYGHHSKLLVSKGDYVEVGQTIGLMGNTGNVRGRTGIHLHFEVIINGARVNPLSYVK